MKKSDIFSEPPHDLVAEDDVLHLLRVLNDELGPSELGRRLGATKQSIVLALSCDRPIHRDIARGLGLRKWKGFEVEDNPRWINELLEGLEPTAATRKPPSKFIEIEE